VFPFLTLRQWFLCTTRTREVTNKAFWIENVPVGVRNAADSMHYRAMSQDFSVEASLS